MSNKVVIPQIATFRRFLNVHGNEVTAPRVSHTQAELTGFNQWLAAALIPSAVVMTFNPFTPATTGAAAGSFYDSYMGGFAGVSKTHHLLILADKSPDATTDLLDNTVHVFLGAKIAARLNVTAASQKGGLHLFHSGDVAGFDNRFGLAQADTALSVGTLPTATKIYSKTAGNHGLETGDRVILTSKTGGTGLTTAGTYFFHKLSPTTGYLCSTYALALAGTPVNSTTDATDVVLSIPGTVGFVLNTLDPALRLYMEGGFTD